MSTPRGRTDRATAEPTNEPTNESDGPTEPSAVVYLVRHGQTALNAGGRLRGLLDPPLDQEGERQVQMLGAAFAELRRRPRRVVAGPLTRTQQTAGAIARALGLEVLTDERLVDRDYGPWTGEPADQVRAQYGPGLVDLPGAEPVAQVVRRARAALDAQASDLAGPVVLVAHDAVNSHLLAALDPALGAAHDITQDTACWNRLERTPSGWRAIVVNGHAGTLHDGPCE
ncbi:MAG: histidine phosphatase family protein [Nocardioides sp.]|uniref:histidine phosphatase family protein n=1 Tax=Nocardioides sp. TaxID=35761 RepID=UPI0039E27A93